MADISSFRASIDAARATNSNDYTDPRIAFLNEMTSLGWQIPQGIIEGKLQRFSLPGEKGTKKSAWYIWHTFPDLKDASRYIGVGSYGSWKGDPECVKWSSRNPSTMTFQDRASYNQQMQAAKAARDAEQLIVYAEAAKEAETIWESANAVSEHPYLAKKKIKGIEIREGRGNLIVPVKYQGHIQSLQFIQPDGTKRFLSGGKTKGGWHMIIGNSDTVCITEGYATGISVYEATGATVYIAFSAGNLYEVASYVKSIHPHARIIICGDEDAAGRVKAVQASDALGIEAIFPIIGTDFNDMACAGGNVKELIEKKPVIAYESKKTEDGEHGEAPNGFLLDLFQFYAATSGNKQPGFAIQTGLAIGSILLGRSFKTNMENYSSLYLLNVGKSSTGKEHGKTVIEQVLHESGQGHLVAGDGYTSAGAVFSALLDRPKHICIIDEFGRHLEASKSNGNHHHKEANTKLMEAIGRCHSVMRPSTYSTMSLKKDAADHMKDRRVHNPAITMLTMTTPVTLFNALDLTAIQDGFVNRFIINISSAERAVRRHKPPIDVPQKILDWVNTIINRNPIMHLASEVPEAIILNFDESAIALQDEFQQFCVDKANSLEKQGISEITGRSNEMAMRISLIVALSRDPMATNITKEDMAWSIEYVKNCLEKTLVLIRSSMNGSLFEKHKKEVLFALRDSSPEYVRLSSMRKVMPYSQHQKKYLQEILDALVESELADSKQSNGAGRPTLEYVALK